MADQSTDSNRKTRVYHPYQDLQVPIQNLYNLPTSPEYLFDEESLHQRRSWSENLQYYTGSGYLSGAIIGGAKGSIEGSGRRRPATRSNSESTGSQLRRPNGDTDDMLNSVFAGLGTGALYRAAAGPRSAVIAGAIGGWLLALPWPGSGGLRDGGFVVFLVYSSKALV
ncbi:Mitochondrial import inner membrane translocase subunit TIM23-1 [Vitis vinifera]|uniref:Mitochondrial import inner membrane translocase subunit TIM23-1 n=1 Tax=Vitis vinifera TaxID=29760 RepID=A0A438F3D8_VITVI|nr:Mitochondrial import inner membrane translocase subunit TIM23-1 [Vitis vinifera]